MCKEIIKKKNEKAEDFIGWKSEDGKLEVTGIYQESVNGKPALFKVTCTKCSKDKELFPEGYFVDQKSNLVNDQKPCGCSKRPRWKDWQFLILARRTGEKKGFIVHGFNEEFKNAKTKLNLECLKDGHKWTASIHSVINSGTGCPKCKATTLAEQRRIPEHIALQKCTDICEEMNYDVIGFPVEYKNCYSRFEYICKIHGKQNICYNSFVNLGSRCGGCARDKQKELAVGFYGYYPERKDEKDFLYILNFNDKFIKVGRSFDVDTRIKDGLIYESGFRDISKIYKLHIFTATHQEIYDYEQLLHNELRERNFQHYVGWSNECFENESLFILNKLLDTCDYERVH